jgi:hypothetical protein
MHFLGLLSDARRQIVFEIGPATVFSWWELNKQSQQSSTIDLRFPQI